MIGGDKRKTKCNHYGKEMHDDGITRLKQHLASGKHRRVLRCEHVPPLIIRQMSNHLAEKEVDKKTKIDRDAALREATLQGSQGYVDVDADDDDGWIAIHI